MYREITLHDLQVRVYRDGKTIQVLRCNGWVNLKYKESQGYPTITLKKNSLRKSYKVSRLVALAFIPNPNNLPVVMHLNNIRTDNRAENLRWGTPKENTQQCIREGRFYFNGGHNKLNPCKVRRIVRCIKLKNYSTIQGLCKKFKISKPSYYRIKKAHFL